MPIVLAATAARATEPGQPGEPQIPAPSAAADADLLARQLLSAGRLDAADAVLDRWLSEEPRNVQARFLKGLIALARGDNGQAIRSFRSILIEHPDAARVRLELARALFLEKDYGNALRQFQFVLAGNPPREVAANIERYLAAIRDAKTASYTLGVSVAPDSNLNTGSSAQEVFLFGLPFDLSDEARRHSGVGVVLEAGGEWAPRIGKAKRFRLGANVQRREYAGSDFDDMTVAGYAGPRLVTGRWDLSLLGTAYQRSYAANTYSDAVGGRAELTYHFSPRLEITATPAAQWVEYRLAHERDGPLMSLSGTGFYALSSSSAVTVKAGASRQQARIAPYSNWSGFAAAGYFKDLPRGFSVYVEPAFSIARYDEALLGFGRTRADTTQSLLVSLLDRHLVLRRFTPRVSYTYTRQASSVTLYEFTRNRLEIGVTTVF